MNPLSRFSPAILLAALAVCPALRADVKLPPVFSDHMVLQRDMAVPVWGMAAPEEEVTVSIAGQTKTTKADAKGLWRVKLDPLKVGPALTLTVKGKNTLTLKDVLVGEVWVGSGQSNMAGTAGGYAKSDENLAKISPVVRCRRFGICTAGVRAGRRPRRRRWRISARFCCRSACVSSRS